MQLKRRDGSSNDNEIGGRGRPKIGGEARERGFGSENREQVRKMVILG